MKTLFDQTIMGGIPMKNRLVHILRPLPQQTGQRLYISEDKVG